MGYSRLIGHLILLTVVMSSCIQPEVQPVTRAIIPAPTAANWSEDSKAQIHWNGDWHWTIDTEWDKRQIVWKAWLPGKSNPKGLSIRMERAVGYAVEGYSLRIDDDGVSIEASEEAGAFHALTTLRWMLPPDSDNEGTWALPHVSISDAPRFEHRGLLLDCCRHFMDPDFVMRTIDLLALHKMNVLHWHLTEDQGWRIEVGAYPELTSTGAWRAEDDGSRHGGFYTKAQIREIVAYAADRNITVIPEVELPGHSRAAIAAYPWLSCTGDSLEVPHDWGVFKDIYCAGEDTTFRFLETVLLEVMDLFPSEYIHIGGDEAPKVRWESCPKCQRRIQEEGLHDAHELQSWFITQIGSFLADHGRKLIGWDEILEGGLPDGATVQSWRGMQGGRDAVAMGRDAIMSPTSHCYFDYPVESIDLERVYGFEPEPEGLEGSGRILGGECNMWSERAPQELVDSKVFPRIVAMSEVLWSSKSQRDWNGFQERMELHYSRLDAWNVDYGWEAVPIDLSCEAAAQTGRITVELDRAISGIEGDVSWETEGIQSRISQAFDAPFEVTGEGALVVELRRNDAAVGKPWRFPLAGHVGVFQPVELDHALNAYYPGGGQQGLADGRLGSMDFRDGCWQATHGEDMGVRLSLNEELQVDSLSMQFYLYQDAWIFVPDSVRFQWSLDGENWKGDWSIQTEWNGADSFVQNEIQGVIRLAVPVNSRAKYIRFEALNPGPCPLWHDAASSDSWLFLDELVVHAN
ncbi:MAG: family 20 glycosylhydrolase [Flavobacteriales bacterium]|nr:family 20 glycosylhydrolase [Flavobacteriales bacterium]